MPSLCELHIVLHIIRINCHLVRKQWLNLKILSGEAINIVRWGGGVIYWTTLTV
ncbi:hypothetical protein CY34DRAFT_550880 [Suillus luteus UH-Slu-Lm8-n1]|uniref:Uncharacterized protein n=1 Tax=Suillus luteus UH-Slu-Lm8-n1 TaxID=930992 RepID=A0A0C9ZER0_9AGAM|nr:hypothetical protein CY34DRAFT_550880 [Suillus luteus UH-Slu-Lm8-n1]